MILEWKGFVGKIPLGQEIMFKKITKRNSIIVFVISGDPEETMPEHIKIFSKGAMVSDEKCDKKKLKMYCKSWESKARDDNA